MILRSKFVQYFGLAFKISFKGYFLESFHANYVEAFSKMVSLTLCTFKHFQSFSKSFKVILECLSTMAMLNLNVVLVHCYFHCGNKCNARLSFKRTTQGNISTTWKPFYKKKSFRQNVYFTSRCSFYSKIKYVANRHIP